MANDWTYWANIARDQENERNNQLREREAEQERLLTRKKDNLVENRSKINTSFDTTFTPEFYSGYAGDLINYWQPDITRQYGDANRTLNYTFADLQPGGGSAGAEAMGRLREAYNKALLAAQDNATSQAQQLRGSVEGHRQALLSSINSDSDPAMVQQQIASTISGIPTAPTYSALGDIFTNITGQFATAQNAYYAGKPGWGFGVRGPAPRSSVSPSGPMSVSN